MSYNVEVVKYEKVQLNSNAAMKIAREILQEAFNLNDDHSINADGKLVEETEYHTSHSWFEKKIIRTALERDKTFFATMKRLSEFEKGIK